jgi:hypothetical protein
MRLRCGQGGAGGESRRVTNGGVGTLGGVTDRLGVAVKAEEASGVEVRGWIERLCLFGRARVFARPFFGVRGGAESADSISIVVSGEVGMHLSFTVTIGGRRQSEQVVLSSPVQRHRSPSEYLFPLSSRRARCRRVDKSGVEALNSVMTQARLQAANWVQVQAQVQVRQVQE